MIPSRIVVKKIYKVEHEKYFANHKVLACGKRMVIAVFIWGRNACSRVFLGPDVPLFGHMCIVYMLPYLSIYAFACMCVYFQVSDM